MHIFLKPCKDHPGKSIRLPNRHWQCVVCTRRDQNEFKAAEATAQPQAVDFGEIEELNRYLARNEETHREPNR